MATGCAKKLNPMSEIVIETRGLSKEFIRDEFHVVALKDINIQIEKGEFVALRNGFLDTCIFPQSHHGFFHFLVSECLMSINLGIDALEMIAIGLVALVLESDLFILHNLVQHAERDNDVGENDSLDLDAFIILKSTGMDNSHLLDDCGFA